MNYQTSVIDPVLASMDQFSLKNLIFKLTCAIKIGDINSLYFHNFKCKTFTYFHPNSFLLDISLPILAHSNSRQTNELNKKLPVSLHHSVKSSRSEIIARCFPVILEYFKKVLVHGPGILFVFKSFMMIKRLV